MDETDESLPTLNADIETEVKEMMGLFDLPAFARRGQDLEITLRRLHERCRAARGELLDMVQSAPPVVARRHRSRRLVRASSPARSSRSGRSAEAEPPQWADSPAPIRRQRIDRPRPDRRRAPVQSPLDAVPRPLEPRAGQSVIDQYNRYYVLEKECVMGSARLAARHFQPVPALTTSTLLNDHPHVARSRAARSIDAGSTRLNLLHSRRTHAKTGYP